MGEDEAGDDGPAGVAREPPACVELSLLLTIASVLDQTGTQEELCRDACVAAYKELAIYQVQESVSEEDIADYGAWVRERVEGMATTKAGENRQFIDSVNICSRGTDCKHGKVGLSGLLVACAFKGDNSLAIEMPGASACPNQFHATCLIKEHGAFCSEECAVAEDLAGIHAAAALETARQKAEVARKLAAEAAAAAARKEQAKVDRRVKAAAAKKEADEAEATVLRSRRALGFSPEERLTREDIVGAARAAAGEEVEGAPSGDEAVAFARQNLLARLGHGETDELLPPLDPARLQAVEDFAVPRRAALEVSRVALEDVQEFAGPAKKAWDADNPRGAVRRISEPSDYRHTTVQTIVDSNSCDTSVPSDRVCTRGTQ